MSKLSLADAVPAGYDKARLQDIIRALCNQVNPLSEGRLSARYNAQSTVPSGSAVSYAPGDFVPDSNCTVTNGSVRLGWVCVAPGTPGSFQEVQVLIANPSMVLLSTATANNSASIIFTGLTAYKQYEIHCSSIIPATNGAILQMTWSTDNGSTYLSTGYYWGLTETDTGGTIASAGTAATSSFRVASASSNASTDGIQHLRIRLSDLSINGNRHGYDSAGSLVRTTGTVTGTDSWGLNTDTSPVTAVKLAMSSGNITAGTFRLYGISGG